MARSQKRMRGVQDIRTLSGAADQAAQPHRGYMRVACLELERFRRGKERESALGRVERLDARFREIESEQAGILATLGRRAAAQENHQPQVNAPASQRTGFKLRY